MLAGLVCWWRGPDYRRAFEVEFYPSGSLFLPDFFQEWASARNRFYGLPLSIPCYALVGLFVMTFLAVRRNPPKTLAGQAVA